MSEEPEAPELEFSGKYDNEHARRYFYKHQHGIGRRLSNWRELNIARRALQLAGNPASVLDLPCGTGRFWELLAEDPQRKIYAADNSQSMLDTGLQLRPPELTQRIEGFQCSAFDIPKPDNFVEHVFCMRLMHHIGSHEDRLRILREFSRVASDTVAVSLWTDGNFKAMRRRQHESRRSKHRYQNRFLIPGKTFEQEIDEAGLDVIGRVHFLRFYSMWVVYVLRVR